MVLPELLYLLAGVLFILGLKRLGSPATARNGNRLAALGMLLAVVVTLVDRQIVSYGVLAAGLIVGTAVGVVLARRVAMTDMPQLVAAFNGFGGGASALVALSEALRDGGSPALETSITIVLSVLIGAITFTGSFVAFGKLQGLIAGRPISFPGQQFFDGLVAAAVVTSGVLVIVTGDLAWLWIVLGASALIGVTRVLPIGGADMPVVIALLNSASGMAAAAAGFVISSTVLIVSGALVGASGLILTGIMVKAMNRTLIGVLAGGFGGTAIAGPTGDKPVKSATADDVGITLAYAQEVIVVPGYGLAVAQAQHQLRELDDLLAERGVNVRYAIHPVAGRMPGHMNVLLAEADVSYDKLFDLDDINSDFSRTDVALVVGANDVVNPSAREDETSPIYGMPILDVDRAQTAVVIKRSLSPGFAGIDNPLFYDDKTLMLFADAKKALQDLISSVKDA